MWRRWIKSVTTVAADVKTLLRYDEIIMGWKRSDRCGEEENPPTIP